MGHGEEWNEAYATLDYCIHQQPHMTSTTIEDADLFLPLQNGSNSNTARKPSRSSTKRSCASRSCIWARRRTRSSW